MKKIFFLLITVFLLTGCSNYINRVYTQLDQDEAQIKNPKQTKGDKFNLYRKKGRNQENQETEQAPRLSTLERKVVDPEVKRQYTPTTEARKRFKAEDLQDNGGSGSLWTGEGKDNSLFVSKHEKQNGDIVVINVMAALKNDITAELKKAYPPETTTPAAKPAADKTAATGADKAAAPAAAASDNMTDETKVYDKISSVVIEEINRDHILLRGRKTLLYNSRKVTVEVQALAPRKNISEDDALDSNTILESTIRVIR